MSFWTIMNGTAWTLCVLFSLALVIDVVRQEFKGSKAAAIAIKKEDEADVE